MTFCDFTTTTYGKWILTGEHAVLRGHSALVFPLKQKQLILHYQPSDSELSADYSGESGSDMHLLFWSVLEQGQHLLGQSLNRLTGHFHLDSNIPLGVGMGASAALCVATARWFASAQLIPQENIAFFAKNLEHLFHGTSSGLDIAGVSTEQGIYFKQGDNDYFQQSWQPQWYLSSCGQIGITSHCINKVEKLWQKDKSFAQTIDIKMQEAVNKSKSALETYNSHSLPLLKEAIEESAECFKAWDLISESLAQHMQFLLDNGALAVKPTGSGAGGYVLSLWETKPPAFAFELVEG